MDMVFFTSTSTPLWSSALTPRNTGQYAGLCIFLIAFAAVFRLVLAIRLNLVDILAAAEMRRTGGLLQLPASKQHSKTPPWTAKEAIIIATTDLIVAGVSYLLWV